MTPRDLPVAIAWLGDVLRRVGMAHAVIGGHAVNAWLEPRFTDDLDLTIQADPDAITRLLSALEADRFVRTREMGENLPSGPDFVRCKSHDGLVTLEFHTAKTDFQRDLLQRAHPTRCGLCIATPEDLLILKAIADRTKDQRDLSELAKLPDLDWAHIDRVAADWEVAAILARVRPRG